MPCKVISLLCPLLLNPPCPPVLDNYWYFYCLHNCAFFRMASSWNHTVWSLFRLVLLLSNTHLSFFHDFLRLSSSFFLSLNSFPLYGCICARSVASVVSDSLRPYWTVAHQAPLSMGFSRQEYWIWVAMPSSMASYWPRDQAHVCLLRLLHFRQILYPVSHLGSPSVWMCYT